MAYQILSDPHLRRKYNEYGAKKEVLPEGGFSDPEELFAQLFGGERFEDIIGTISIGRDMADALKHAPDSTDKNGNEVTNDPPLSEAEREEKDKLEKAKQEEKEKVRAERVLRLSEALEKRLDDFVRIQDNVESLEKYQEKHRNEAEELKTESYGVEILHAVGFTYIAKSKAYLSRVQSYFGGISGMWHGVKGTVHVLSETVGTLRSAMELKNHFERIEKEEKEGKLTEERRKILEDQAAEKVSEASFANVFSRNLTRCLNRACEPCGLARSSKWSPSHATSAMPSCNQRQNRCQAMARRLLHLKCYRTERWA